MSGFFLNQKSSFFAFLSQQNQDLFLIQGGNHTRSALRLLWPPRATPSGISGTVTLACAFHTFSVQIPMAELPHVLWSEQRLVGVPWPTLLTVSCSCKPQSISPSHQDGLSGQTGCLWSPPTRPGQRRPAGRRPPVPAGSSLRGPAKAFSLGWSKVVTLAWCIHRGCCSNQKSFKRLTFLKN